MVTEVSGRRLFLAEVINKSLNGSIYSVLFASARGVVEWFVYFA